jgi:hypothetical protein
MAGALAFAMVQSQGDAEADLLDLDSMNILESTQENVGVAVNAGAAGDAISGDVKAQVAQIADNSDACANNVGFCNAQAFNIGVGIGLSGPALSFGSIDIGIVNQLNVGAVTQVAPNVVLNASPEVNVPVDASPVINIGGLYP